jgi:hypothetical protein
MSDYDTIEDEMILGSVGIHKVMDNDGIGFRPHVDDDLTRPEAVGMLFCMLMWLAMDMAYDLDVAEYGEGEEDEEDD